MDALRLYGTLRQRHYKTRRDLIKPRSCSSLDEAKRWGRRYDPLQPQTINQSQESIVAGNNKIPRVGVNWHNDQLLMGTLLTSISV